MHGIHAHARVHDLDFDKRSHLLSRWNKITLNDLDKQALSIKLAATVGHENVYYMIIKSKSKNKTLGVTSILSLEMLIGIKYLFLFIRRGCQSCQRILYRGQSLLIIIIINKYLYSNIHTYTQGNQRDKAKELKFIFKLNRKFLEKMSHSCLCLVGDRGRSLFTPVCGG